MPPMKICLGCGDPTPGPDPRCPACRSARNSATWARKRERRPLPYAERQRRAAVVQAWREQMGDVCPGWGRPAHASSDLTADHVTAYAATGDESSELTVLCRSCNSRKSSS